MVTFIDKYSNDSNLVLGASNMVLGAGNLNLGAMMVFAHNVYSQVIILAPHS